ncbi:hypothetical protein CC78DRAFT_542071 [Lojkania enalia]|uniref:Uncharacterized protein n=1 Tax=Lojkania enalia TaxID=147567 RepID=A0A9P4KI75_9PLEO|nr:hypothetical protein CC78DRAFT_542071 [Didymosphaeria enalia]
MVVATAAAAEGLSVGAKVRIGIGIPLVVLLLVAIGVDTLMLLRWTKRSKGDKALTQCANWMDVKMRAVIISWDIFLTKERYDICYSSKFPGGSGGALAENRDQRVPVRFVQVPAQTIF